MFLDHSETGTVGGATYVPVLDGNHSGSGCAVHTHHLRKEMGVEDVGGATHILVSLLD